MKKVAVIILNYKVKDLVIGCIKTVQRSTLKNLEIIVVDNNSQDDLQEEIKKIPNIQFIQNSENLGYTGGNNIGIKKALADGADYVFVLNPDIEVDNKAIENLVSVVGQEQAGIVGPKVLFADRKTIWYAGGIFDRANVLGKHRGIDEKDRGQYDKAQETEYVTGGAIMIAKEVFDKIGLFDEKYFLYYEDSDFCFRAKEAGFKIMYVPQAVIYHANASSAGLGSSLQDYYITRNRMLFASKFLSIRTILALLREAIRNILNPVRRLALFDFLIGNFGKGSF